MWDCEIYTKRVLADLKRGCKEKHHEENRGYHKAIQT